VLGVEDETVGRRPALFLLPGPWAVHIPGRQEGGIDSDLRGWM